MPLSLIHHLSGPSARGLPQPLLRDRCPGPQAQAGNGCSRWQFSSTADSDLPPGLGACAQLPSEHALMSCRSPRAARPCPGLAGTRSITLSSLSFSQPSPSPPTLINPHVHSTHHQSLPLSRRPCLGPQGQPWAPCCSPASVPTPTHAAPSPPAAQTSLCHFPTQHGPHC